MSTAQVRLFGEFRSWVRSGEISVDLEGRQTVADLKKGLIDELRKLDATREGLESLMTVSALAEETRILLDSEKLADLRTSSFALLPPVCGG